MADQDDVCVLYESREDSSRDCICIGVEKKGKDPLSGRRARKSKKFPPATQSAGESGAIVVDLDELEEFPVCISLSGPSCSKRSSHLRGGTAATNSLPDNTTQCSIRPTCPIIVSDSTSESSSCVGERSGSLVSNCTSQSSSCAGKRSGSLLPVCTSENCSCAGKRSRGLLSDSTSENCSCAGKRSRGLLSDSTSENCSCVGEKSGSLVSKVAESTTNSSCVRSSFTLTRTSQSANDQLPLNYSSNGFGESDEDNSMEVDMPAPKRRNTSPEIYLQNILGGGGTPSLVADKDCTLQDHNDEEIALPLPRDGFVDADYKLALELSKQLNYSASKQPQLTSNSPDAELARQLQEEEYSQRRTSTSSCQLAMDEEFARKLQEEEEVQFVKAVKGRSPKKAYRRLSVHAAMDEDSSVQIVKATKVEISKIDPRSQSVGASSSNTSTPLPGTATSLTKSVQLSAPSADPSSSSTIPMAFSSSLGSDGGTSGSASKSLHHFPSTWTKCPNCHPDTVRKYHLIDVLPETEEWSHVASPLTSAGFLVKRVQRIQNSSLWQRLQYEKQLLEQDRPVGFDLNEKLLFHTSRAEKAVICEEGLDQRLSRNGNFGSGIYFSDDPVKCDQYWFGRDPRRMFACRVLLGEIKEYARGSVDPNLRREPPKVAPKRGEHKTYDSVLGNISGQNEYVVYNAYRVVPEYVMDYSQHHGRSVLLHRALSQHKARAAAIAQRRNAVLQAAALQTPSLPSFNFGVPPPVTSTPATTTNLATRLTPAVDDGACYLCTKDPTTCKCGLTSRKLCKHCKNKPPSCTCPFFTTANSKEIPYRCLTPLLQRWVKMQSRARQPKPSKK